MADVMISLHCGTMMQPAKEVQKYLHENGYSTWLCDDMEAGASYRLDISVAASTSKAVVLLINERWCMSAECQFEFNIALRKHFLKNAPALVAVLLEDFKVYEKYPIIDGFLCNFNGIVVNGGKLTPDYFPKIISSLKSFSVNPSGGGSKFILKDIGTKAAVPEPAAPTSTDKAGQFAPTVAAVVTPQEMASSGDYFFAFVNSLWRLNANDPTKYMSIASGWSGAIAATMCKGYLFAATKSGNMWKVDTNGQSAALEGTGWENSKAMVTCGGKVFVYRESLFAIDPETGKSSAVASGWGGTICACSVGEEMFAATEAGHIWRVKQDGTSSKLCTGGWHETKAMVGLGGKIYAFVNDMWVIDITTGTFTSIAKSWSGCIAACAVGGNIVAVTKAGNLWLVKTDGSNVKLEENWRDTKVLVSYN